MNGRYLPSLPLALTLARNFDARRTDITYAKMSGYRCASAASLVIAGGALAAATWIGGEHELAVGLAVLHALAGGVAFLWSGATTMLIGAPPAAATATGQMEAQSAGVLTGAYGRPAGNRADEVAVTSHPRKHFAQRNAMRNSSQHSCRFGYRSGIVTGVTDREVYPSAPVVLVALEVRHPMVEPMSAAAIARAKKILRGATPLQEPQTIAGFAITPAGAAAQPAETAQRFSSRDRATAVTFRGGAVIVQTTQYGQYDDLRKVIELALRAREAAAPVDGVLRVGLRYIDEIRVPSDNDLLGWAEWVNPSLLGPAPLAADHGLNAAQWQGLAVFNGASDAQLVLRYGPGEGYAVDPGGELRRPAPAPGPFFLLDIDNYWVPNAVPDFDVAVLLQRCDDLHKPIRALFESLITEKLRKEVLRHVG